jgi:hypothetical protein
VTCAKTFHLRMLVCIGVGDGAHHVWYGAPIRLARSLNVVLPHTTLHTPLNYLGAVAMPSLASCSPTHGSCWEEEYAVSGMTFLREVRVPAAMTRKIGSGSGRVPVPVITVTN